MSKRVALWSQPLKCLQGADLQGVWAGRCRLVEVVDIPLAAVVPHLVQQLLHTLQQESFLGSGVEKHGVKPAQLICRGHVIPAHTLQAPPRNVQVFDLTEWGDRRWPSEGEKTARAPFTNEVWHCLFGSWVEVIDVVEDDQIPLGGKKFPDHPRISQRMRLDRRKHPSRPPTRCAIWATVVLAQPGFGNMYQFAARRSCRMEMLGLDSIRRDVQDLGRRYPKDRSGNSHRRGGLPSPCRSEQQLMAWDAW